MGNSFAFGIDRRKWNDVIRCRLFLVAFQGGMFDLGFARVGAMHGLAVMAECFLGEPFRVAAKLRPLRPRIIDFYK